MSLIYKISLLRSNFLVIKKGTDLQRRHALTIGSLVASVLSGCLGYDLLENCIRGMNFIHPKF